MSFAATRDAVLGLLPPARTTRTSPICTPRLGAPGRLQMAAERVRVQRSQASWALASECRAFRAVASASRWPPPASDRSLRVDEDGDNVLTVMMPAYRAITVHQTVPGRPACDHGRLRPSPDSLPDQGSEVEPAKCVAGCRLRTRRLLSKGASECGWSGGAIVGSVGDRDRRVGARSGSGRELADVRSGVPYAARPGPVVAVQAAGVMLQPLSWWRPSVTSRLRLIAAQRWDHPSWFASMPR